MDQVLEALRSQDPSAVVRGAESAGQQRRKDAVLLLIPLLYSTNKHAIAAAARALGEIGDLQAMQHLGEAGYAPSLAGGMPGFDTYTAGGTLVPVAEEDVLVANALSEAEQQMWRRPAGPCWTPAGEAYLATLGQIRMHTIKDLFKNVLVAPEIQGRARQPFTMAVAQRFFRNFANERFGFEGNVQSIYVAAGEEGSQHSLAEGRLYSQTLDEMERIGDSALEQWIGTIHFRLGTNLTVPRVSVIPEPRWPVPSIVRRPMTDGSVRFEEIR